MSKKFQQVALFIANKFSLLSYKIVSSKYFVGKNALFTKSSPASADFGIVIVTFEARQFSRALPLIKQIRLSGVVEPIALIFNGDFNAGFNSDARRDFISELSAIPNVFPLFLRKFHGLAHNWNLGIRVLGCDTTLVLNDDLWIDQSKFKSDLESLIENNNAAPLITINTSFSHFIIRKSCISNVGWFDERFLGIGEEDGDYFLRYIRNFSEPPTNLHVDSIIHFNDHDSGSELKGVSKYSLANLLFSQFKYSLPVDGDPGVFGERRIPNFDPTFRLAGEDFSRSMGDWHNLDEKDFNAKSLSLFADMKDQHGVEDVG